MACANELENVANKILEEYKDNINYITHNDEEGLTAFDYVCENNIVSLINSFVKILPITVSIPILVKYRLYFILKELIDNNENYEEIKKLLLNELCVSDIIDLVTKITSKESIACLTTYIETLEKSPIDCLICCKPTVTHYLFTPCKHVLKLDTTCVRKLNYCPICRKSIENKEIVFMV